MYFPKLLSLTLATLLSPVIFADFITITSPANDTTINTGQQLAINLKVTRADLAAIGSVNVRLLNQNQSTIWEINYPHADAQGEWLESFTWPIRNDLAEGQYILNAYSNASYFSGKGRSYTLREANVTLTLLNSTPQ